MKTYTAQKDNTGIFLTRPEQAAEMLAKGWLIYEMQEDGTQTLLANPRGRSACPVLEVVQCRRTGGKDG